MSEIDVLRIALIILFLGFSLPGILKIKTGSIASKNATGEETEEILQPGHVKPAKKLSRENSIHS